MNKFTLLINSLVSNSF